jgi:methylglyoxal synthase
MAKGEKETRYQRSCDLLNKPDHWQATLGILTCKFLREEGREKLFDEVAEILCSRSFSNFLSKHNWQVAMTGGTYDALMDWMEEHNCLKDFPLDRAHRLPRSALGVIQVANLVVYGFCTAILFFNEMEDYYADSPQNLCLRRICNQYDVPLIEDFVSIRHMLQQQWYKGSLPRRSKGSHPSGEINQYLYGDEVLYAQHFEDSRREERKRETLAIVSHDGKKMEMLTFCLEHMWKILSYRRVLATGTSGQRLRDLYDAALTRQPRLSRKLRQQIGWLPDQDAKDFIYKKILTFQSGPKGGDIQISSKIIDGTCHRVIFFQDPHTAHPHQFDIRLMEKAAQDRETGALFATSEHMARLIV